MSNWRPGGWLNPYLERHIVRVRGIQHLVNTYPYGDNAEIYEAGADAMLEKLFKLADESPTGKFTIESASVNIFQVRQ